MHFGTGKLVRATRHGTIKNMPVTSQDLYRANAIYGPSVPHLKGTTVTHPTKVHKDEWVPRMVMRNQGYSGAQSIYTNRHGPMKASAIQYLCI